MDVNAFIQHHGVKGMHWGVSTAHLTSAKEGVDAASGLVRSVGSIHDAVRKTKKTSAMNDNLKSMSDEELRKRVNRMSMEKQFSSLSKDQINNGESRVKKILDTTGNVLAIGSSSLAIALAIQKLRM